MTNTSFNYFCGEDILIAYLDLCGTKNVYNTFSLAQQLERLSIVIRNILQNIDAFDKNKNALYVHMFADSIVIAEKEKIENCAEIFLKLMFDLQYQILIDSESLEGNKENTNPNEKRVCFPILSRALVKRGKYYGLIDGLDNKTEGHPLNFSLVGGSAILEMDKSLQGLPMGTYIDNSLLRELTIGNNRLLDVSGEKIKFVRPQQGFDFLQRQFSSDENIDKWGERLLAFSGNNADFSDKLLPWIEAIQGRREVIAKRIKNSYDRLSCSSSQ